VHGEHTHQGRASAMRWPHDFLLSIF